MSKLILYGVPMSTYVARVRIALTYKGFEFEEREPADGYRSAQYRKLVPMGSIPALVDDDFVLSESAAIIEYLEELKPDPALLPATSQARARVRALIGIHDGWIEPRLRALYPLLDNVNQHSTQELERRKLAIDDLVDRLNRFDHQIDPSHWAMSPTISAADCAWSTTLLQIEIVLAALQVEYQYSQYIQRWRQRIDNHPAFLPSINACRTAMTGWIASKS